MGSCCCKCCWRGFDSTASQAASTTAASVTPVSFHKRSHLQRHRDPPDGVDNAAFNGSTVDESAPQPASMPDIQVSPPSDLTPRSSTDAAEPPVTVSSSSSQQRSCQLSHGPQADFHFPDWLATVAGAASTTSGSQADKANNRHHAADAAVNNHACRKQPPTGSGATVSSSSVRQQQSVDGATQQQRQQATAPTETEQQRYNNKELQQPQQQLLQHHHSFHGDDVYRFFVESSARVKSSILSLFSRELTKGSGSLTGKRKNEWIQLSGHSGTFAVAGPWSIWKRRDPREISELQVYKELMQDELMRQFVPVFYREVQHQGEYFLELEDLLHHFSNPSIMDVKMGSRTFLESEVTNPILRTDLYRKMVEIDPAEPTDVERANQAVTKLRYMKFREEGSTSLTLGYRLEAIKTKNKATCEKYVQRLKNTKTEAEVADIVHYFCAYNSFVMRQFAKRLTDLKAVLEKSSFFSNHEFIGSSLLFLHDESLKASVWMIDFAKTVHYPSGGLKHTVEWSLGNHEDGYMTGLNNLIRLMESMADQYV